MTKPTIIQPFHNLGNQNHILNHIEHAHIISPTNTYLKYLPETTPEIHMQFLQASGDVAYTPTNNYMFQGLFQEDTEALTNLICAILHWPHSKVKSLEITNPVILGQYIVGKTVIHIGFLDFTLFHHQPELHAIYKMQNIKSQNVYSDKFILHVIELNNINLATDEDHYYEIDRWASLFKAKTWEDIRMLVNDNPTLQTAAETLYRLNMDVRFRETCERFAQAEIEHNSVIQRNIELTQTNEALLAENAQLKTLLASYDNAK